MIPFWSLIILNDILTAFPETPDTKKYIYLKKLSTVLYGSSTGRNGYCVPD